MTWVPSTGLIATIVLAEGQSEKRSLVSSRRFASSTSTLCSIAIGTFDVFETVLHLEVVRPRRSSTAIE